MKTMTMKEKKSRAFSIKKLIILSILIMLIFVTPSFADPIDNVASYAQERIITIFLVIVGGIIVKNLIKNTTNKLIGFIGIAAIGAVFVYKPEILGKIADWGYNIIF